MKEVTFNDEEDTVTLRIDEDGDLVIYDSEAHRTMRKGAVILKSGISEFHRKLNELIHMEDTG